MVRRHTVVIFMLVAGCGDGTSTQSKGPAPQGGASPAIGGSNADAAAGRGAMSGFAAGGASGTGNTGGGNDFLLGTWGVGTPAIMPSCTDADVVSQALQNFSTLVLAEGTTSDLVATFICDWQLDVSADGTRATLVRAQSCTTTDPIYGFVYTWRGRSFTLNVTRPGSQMATMSAALDLSFTDRMGVAVACTIDLARTISWHSE